LFLLLAFLLVVVVGAAGLENTDPSSATLFDRSFSQLSEGQLLVVAAGLGFLVALFLFLAFGASRSRRSRRKELRSRRRDAEGRVDELERENARLTKDLAEAHERLDATERNRDDAVAERDRAEDAVDRIRADRPAGHDPTVAPVATDDQARSGDRPAAGPPRPESATRERLDDRTVAPIAPEEHARAADEHARAADEHARAADEEEARR
jgi:TolA-binding protein